MAQGAPRLPRQLASWPPRARARVLRAACGVQGRAPRCIQANVGEQRTVARSRRATGNTDSHASRTPKPSPPGHPSAPQPRSASGAPALAALVSRQAMAGQAGRNTNPCPSRQQPSNASVLRRHSLAPSNRTSAQVKPRRARRQPAAAGRQQAGRQQVSKTSAHGRRPVTIHDPRDALHAVCCSAQRAHMTTATAASGG